MTIKRDIKDKTESKGAEEARGDEIQGDDRD